jgi:hypothetical protein
MNENPKLTLPDLQIALNVIQNLTPYNDKDKQDLHEMASKIRKEIDKLTLTK